MSKLDVIRAWKDESYRTSLSQAQRAELPLHPVGDVAFYGPMSFESDWANTTTTTRICVEAAGTTSRICGVEAAGTTSRICGVPEGARLAA